MATNYKADTIAAIATPSGQGAIGIIRCSGSEAITKVNNLFRGRNLAKVSSHTAHYGTIKADGQPLDEGVVTVFRGPHSYTGEDVVELSCHGSPYVLRNVMEAILRQGVRHADAGEFTLRAFLNGKMDLSQAEGVADLIASESESSRDAAIHQLRGGFSAKIRELRERLLNFSSLLELELDFSEEDVEFANRQELQQTLDEIYQTVKNLADSYQMGNVLKEGVSVVIAGRPNAGKSTLLNALLNDERAIVSDIPGTTRDVVEDTLQLQGVKFRFSDTAGIRTSDDTIERIGVERTMQNLEKANIVIYIFDVNAISADEVEGDLERLQLNKPYFLVGNKIDQGHQEQEKLQALGEVVMVSAEKGENLEAVKDQLLAMLELHNHSSDQTVVTNLRHYQALIETLEAVGDIYTNFQQGISTDFITIDIRRALYAMGEITGEITNEDILGNIFQKFCIGK